MHPSLKLILLPLAITLSATAMAQNLNATFQKAEQYRQQEFYKQAIPLYEQFLKSAPDNVKANYGLGLCLLNGSNKTKAYLYLQKACDIDPNLPDVDLFLGRAYQLINHFPFAIECYSRGLEKIDKVKEPGKFRAVQKSIIECKNGADYVAHPVKAKIDNIGSAINTKYHEYAVALSEDENTMVFTSRREGSSNNKVADDGDYFEDIYIARKVNGQWGTPQNLGKQVNTEGHDASIAVSADGTEIFIYRDDNGGDIYYSNLVNGEWTKPQGVSKKINSKYNECSVSLSADGQTLYFTSDRPGGLGGKDIYLSHLGPDGQWGEPLNLGNIVNTPDDDDAPFIHPDGQTLYFSSRGHKSMGGYDIYKSEFTDGHWSTPENLGYPINSTDNDIYFVLSADNKRGYYASAKEGGYGENDIYIISMPPPDELRAFKPMFPRTVTVDKPIFEASTNQGPVAEPIYPFTIFRGLVSDAKTKSPLPAASVTINDIASRTKVAKTLSNENGEFEIALLSGYGYGVEVEKEQYLFFSDNINSPYSPTYQLLMKYIELNKVAVGTKLVLKNVFYDFGKATLRPESVTELDVLYGVLLQYPEIKIEISGHTDNVGSDDYNKKLSAARAKTVVDYLIKKGIPALRLKSAGYGKERPVATNDNEEGRQQNRRTEFEILED